MRSLWSVLLLTFALGAELSAQVAYDGGAPTGMGGSPISSLATAQGFSLGTTTAFNEIRFWGINFAENTPVVGALTWTIYDRSGSTRGSVIASGSATPEAELRVPGSYQHDMGVGPRTLAAGDYFLEFSGAPSGTRWEWTSPNDLPAQIRSTSSGSIVQTVNDMAFQLRNVTVPEPSSFALVAAGAALIGMRLARRRGRSV